jgi:hypothetical protein
MARWVLDCPDCNKEFTHSEIPENNRLIPDPFTGTVTKSEFPAGGFTVTCPNCKKISVYQRYELTYRAS